MSENFALYSQTLDSLPEEQMLKLADGICPAVSRSDAGLCYRFNWSDLTMTCHVMPREKIRDHLRGFIGYIRHIFVHGMPAHGEKLIQRVQNTRLIIGVEISPSRNPEERCDELVGKLSFGLRPIIFHADSIFDQNSRLLLDANGRFDPTAEVE